MRYETRKRAFDLIAAGTGLVLLAPVGLLIAALIKLGDGGPVFFGQMRVGQFGKPFRIWKFRSMVVNAEKAGGVITGEDDSRITRVGRLLRKTKLDELPQLWNVFRGEMSLVGPRPEVPSYVARYNPEQRRTLEYRPGITDVASLLFRSEEQLLSGAGDLEAFYLRYCLPKKIELNLEYARRATLVRDIGIIVQTVVPYWAAVLVVYAVCFVFSFWFAYLLRSDFQMPTRDYREFAQFLPLVVLPQLALVVWRGQLRGLLSYFSIPEMRRTAIALGGAFLLQAGLCYPFQSGWRPSPSILLMDLILSFFTVCGVRMGFRMLREACSRGHREELPLLRVALIGTGELATNLLLDFARSKNPGRQVVAFFDDDPHNWHKRPHNIPVIGMPECLLNREWRQQIDEVIVTLPKENSTRIQQLTEMLRALPCRIVIASEWPALRSV